MSTPYGQNPDDDASAPEQDPRPEPRYGQYAPRSEDASSTSGSTGEPDGADSADQGSPYGQPANPGGDSGYSGGQYNPYGQPTWGQPQQSQGWQNPPAGSYQPQPDFAQAPGGYAPGGYAPAGYPSAGAQPFGSSGKPKRAGTLMAALFLLIGAAVSALAWGIYTFADLPMQNPDQILSPSYQQMFIEQMQADPQFQGVSEAEVLELMLLSLGLMALVWAVVVAVIYVAMAFVGTMTGNVGRILATIWIAGSLFLFFFGYNGGSYGLILTTVVLSFAALVMLWLPASNKYIRDRRTYKEFQRSGGYSAPGYGSYSPPQQPGTYQG